MEGTLFVYRRGGEYHVARLHTDHLALKSNGWTLIKVIDPLRYVSELFQHAHKPGVLQNLVQSTLCVYEDEDGSDPS